MVRILVGIDFSPASRNATAWAARQLGPDLEMILMHAIDIPHPPRTVGGSLEHRIQRIETARRGAETRLDELRATLMPSARIRIRVGRPDRELALSAREVKAELIVVGEASRRTGLSRVLGTTVEALIRRSPVPVLLARSSPDVPVTRILLAVDDSPRAAQVLAEGRKLALRFGAEVTVLHVVPAGLRGTVGIAASERELRHAVHQLERSSAVRIEAQVAALRSAGVWAEALCVPGDPAPKILEIARELPFDMVVVGLRRPGRLERTMFGVIAHEVLGHAQCPVLVAVPPAAPST